MGWWCSCGIGGTRGDRSLRGGFGWGRLAGGVVRRLLLRCFAGWVDGVHIRNGMDIVLGSDLAEMVEVLE